MVREGEERDKDTENIFEDIIAKLPWSGRQGNRHPGPESIENPKQEPKEDHQDML